MDYQIEIRFKKLIKELEETFGEGLDLESVLFLIGVQELGKGYQDFTKRQKLELMHVGMCSILTPYGFYKKIGRDEENWPHFELLKNLPPLSNGQQNHLIKEAVLSYFDEENSGKPTQIDISESLKNWK